MITTLRLQNFKCFEDQIFDLKAITLLSGLNGMGKSTVLQSILLLRQSFQQGTLPHKGLALNGDAISLGTGRDIFYEDAQDTNISFELVSDTAGSANWKFEYEAEADLLALLQTKCNSEALAATSLLNDNFHYLQAERIGPRPAFSVSDYAVDRHRQIGTRGEYTVHFLAVYGDSDVRISALNHTEAASNNLRHQVEAWMGEVSPGVRVTINAHRNMDIVNLEYSFNKGSEVSNNYRATSVGFGITYTLPVLTAILSASPGTMLMLENPEAHLHPHGQVVLGELLAKAAANGVQVLLETHSDHVLNGLRLAVHHGHISSNDTRLYYFGRQVKDGRYIKTVTAPNLDKNGRIDAWPDGFFDESEKSLTALLIPSGVQIGY